MDIGIFDHYEEDGQLSFFGFQDYDDGIWAPEDIPMGPDGEPEEEASSWKEGNQPGKTEEGMPKERDRESKDAERTVGKAGIAEAGDQKRMVIRIGNCACCGRILLVEEKEDSYVSGCGSCGVAYTQRK